MKIDRLQLVKLRNSFYKDGFRRISLMLLLSMIINFILIVTLLVSQNKVQKPIYFAAGMDGTLKKLTPVGDPVYNDEQIQQWVSKVIPSIMHLDFLSKEEKDVFKTAFELDQKWIIELGGDRTPYISQAQSIKTQTWLK